MIAVYGGTFDPVHYGHLRMAWEAAELLGAAELRLIPAWRPPHRHPPVASPGQRLRMLELALSGQDRLRLDPREYQRGGISYMVDTLASLRAELGTTVPLCLVLGADAYAGLPGWRRWRELPGLAHLLVLERPGESGDPWPAELAELDAGRRAPLERLAEAPAGAVHHRRARQLEISASEIRRLITAGREPRYLLPAPVLDLIRQERLYLQPDPED